MRKILLFALSVIASGALAQGIGINTNTPHASSLLELSSTDRGFLMTRMTAAQRDAIAAPAEGLLIYNTDAQCYEGYNSLAGKWIKLGCIECNPPQAFAVSAATGISDTSFNANWNSSPSASAYYLEVDNNADFSSPLGGYNSLNVGNVLTYNVQGLDCDSTYYYRVTAEDSCGTVLSSNADTVLVDGCSTFPAAFAAWDYRKKFTVLASQVATNVTDFPVFVNLAHLGSDFHSNVMSDGRDIRITKADGITELPRELVRINTGGQTGELHFRADALSSSANTDFYIYYGNSGATAYADGDTYGARNVWNSDYVAVYHMDEASGSAKESTANGNTGAYNGTLPNQAAGEVGNAQHLDGSTDYVEVGISSSLQNLAQVHVSAWVRPDFNDNNSRRIVTLWETGDLLGQTFILTQLSSGILAFYVNQGGSAYTATRSWSPSAGTWYYFTGKYDGSNVHVAIDNNRTTGSSLSGTLTNRTGDMWIGQGATSNSTFPIYLWDGRIDEVRILKVARTDGWETTEYNNQSAPTSFYNVDVQEMN